MQTDNAATTRRPTERHRGRRRLFGLAPCRLGATAVEFALVVPVFLTMMIGLFEMSRAMWIKATMQYAVEEAARYFIVNNSADTATIEGIAQTALETAGVSSTGVTFDATQGTSGSIDIMTVTATYNFTAITPLPFPDVTLSVKSVAPFNS